MLVAVVLNVLQTMKWQIQENPKKAVSMQILYLNLFEQPAFEATSSDSFQCMPDNELVNSEDCPEDGEIVNPDIAEVDQDDVQEVVNLGFINSIDEIVTNSEENNTQGTNYYSGCTTVTLGVDYQQDCSKEFVDKVVGTEDNFESQEELLEKLRHQQWLF